MDGILILDQPRSGAENMAIDDAMLQWCDEHQAAALRVYLWAKPTLSLGYFQPWEELLGYAQAFQNSETQEAVSVAAHQDSTKLDLPLNLFHGSLDIVRRRTGGGAIIHDHDWTYSLVLPWDQRKLGPTKNLYHWVHTGLVEWLKKLGFQATLQADSEPASKSAEFLCFLRRTEGDILVGNDKVIGSAQRRGKQSILQHGSVLLKRSSFAPILAGLKDIPATTTLTTTTQPDALFNATSFGDSIRSSLATDFGINWREADQVLGFNGTEVEQGRRLHQSPQWFQRV